ncbi:MAG: ABC transporter permease [Thaumarchaeota archaeon]|nr:ABC transporter permease [Nitrososphaerota archaeon]
MGKRPTNLGQVGVIMKYTFVDYLRSRRFLILLGIILAVATVLTAVVGYYRPASYLSTNLGFYSSWWGMTAVFIVILSGIFFGGDAISGEFQNKTGYFTLPNPVRRSSVYVGKWLAAFVASTTILLIFAAITVANAIFYFGGAGLPYQFGEALLFSWFYLSAVLGFTFFFSSLFKSSSYSILLTAVVFLFAFTVIEALVQNLAQIEPWFVLNYAAGMIGGVLTDPYPPHMATVTSRFGSSLTSYNVTIPEGLAIVGTYFLVTAIIGLILFERKEFN